MKNPNSLENKNRKQYREIIVLAHNIRSTHNIGSILRTSEGFGVSRVIFSGYSPFPTLDNENFQETNRLPHIAQKIAKLKSEGFEIIALEQSIESIKMPDFSADKCAKIALLLGEEVNGIEERLLALCDKHLEIPMFGQKESFNVSVAAGIALYKIACE